MTKVSAEKLERVIRDLFAAAGSDAREASILGKNLTDANLVGHDSHGVIRVPAYIEQVLAGKILVNQHISVMSEIAGITLVDGNMGLGQAVGEEVVDLGVTKSGEHGIALVGLRNCGHLGRIGYWAEKAALAGVVSLHFVSAASPGGAQIAAFGGRDRRMAANPLAFGMPVKGGAPIVADIATSEIAVGKIRIARNKKERLPKACIITVNGDVTDDPNFLFADPPGAVMNFGGHKGYALNFFIDLLGGALTGAGINHRGAATKIQSGNNMLSIFIAPDLFIDTQTMAAQVLDYIAWLKESLPLTEGDNVRVPGENSRQKRERGLREGISIDETTWEQLLAVAQKVGLKRSDIDSR